LPQNALIGILPIFKDGRRNATPSFNNAFHASLTSVGGPCRGSEGCILDIALLLKKEKKNLK